jgi:SAM-dependent methyltransferase
MHQYSLPLFYHLHHSQHQEDLPFWLDLAKKQGSPILELGCGTGRILLPLILSGCKAVGLDLDAQMLAFLKSQWPAGRATPPIFLADMAHFHLASFFSLILLPCNTLSTLTPLQRLSMFERVAAHLFPTGWFAASLPNPVLYTELQAQGESEVEDYIVSPVDGEPVQVSSAWERSTDFFTVFWHYDHLLSDGRVDRVTIQTRHSLASADTYLDELERSNLKVITLYGDFDQSPYNPDSPNLIIIAGKKAPSQP